jgi:copper chaperone
MLAYRIEDMTCGGCVRAIRAAVARVAPTATVHADVEARSVRIEGADDASGIGAAIAAAGFGAVPLEPAAAEAPAARGGCGGGGCRCSG